MKTTIIYPALLVLLVACGPQELASTEVSDDEVRTLSVPEPGASPGEYSRRTPTLRLFGTQLNNDDGAQSFATLADIATWHTRDYRLGEAVGRSLRVSRISDAGIELSGAAGVLSLAVGADLAVPLIEHVFDTAAIDRGRHVISVHAPSIGQIRNRYGVGAQAEAVDFAGRAAIRLSAVAPQSALSRLGFSEGDLLFAVDVAAVAPADLPGIVDRLLTSHAGVVTVAMGHGHSFYQAAFVTR